MSLPSPKPKPKPKPRLKPISNKPLQHAQTAEAVKLNGDAIAAIRDFLEVYPLMQYPKREPGSEMQNFGCNDKFGATILPLSQQTEYMNAKSPAWPLFIKFYGAIAPYIIQASAVLAQDYPQIYHIARHITESSYSTATEIISPSFWTTQEKYLPRHPHPHSPCCFSSLRLTANISYAPQTFTSTHPIGPLVTITPLGFWEDAGGNLVISRPCEEEEGRNEKSLTLAATEGALHVEFCDSRVGVDGFAGERYQLEFFLPDFNPAGCGGDADGGGLRRVLESMPKEVRKPMRSEAMYEAVEAWLQERLKREEDQGMEIDSKPRRASSRKGKETIAVKLEQEEEGMEMNSKPTRASSRKVKGTVTVSVELEREDDSMEIDTTPRPASSPRKRKEGPVNLDIRSKRLKLSRKTPRRPQGLDSHGGDTSQTTRSRRATTTTTTTTKVKREEDDDNTTKPWCFCKKPEGDRRMIGCDDENCRHQWFHISCIGLDKKKRLPDKWYCPECMEVRRAAAAAVNESMMSSQGWEDEDAEMR